MDLPPPERQGRPRARLARLTAVACALVLVAALVTGAYRLGERGSGAVIEIPVGDGGTAEVGEDLAPVAELFNDLRAEAVEAPDEQALVEGALQGMVEALGDPYARYYDAVEYASFNEQLDGSFTGIGVELQEREDGLFVVSVFDGTPADDVGIESGEQLVSVDGEDIRNEPIERVVRMVQGEEGTDVVIGLEGGSQGAREVTITRARIQIPDIEVAVLEDGAGHIRLMQFNTGAGDRVREAVDDLIDDGATGIVLDLRNNPGGLLREAVRVASVFIESGPIVSVQERVGDRQVLEATGEAFTEVPMVVLVNSGTASASEIVAGAIQDTERGQVVGERTFGKGTVQTIQSLADGSGAKFTTARYYTPSGDSIEEVGVKPDRQVTGEEAQLSAAQEVLRQALATAAR